jgi:hypothetical protein
VDGDRDVLQAEAPRRDLRDELRRHRLRALTDGLTQGLDERGLAVGVLQVPLVAGIGPLDQLLRVLGDAPDPIGRVVCRPTLGRLASMLAEHREDRPFIVVDQLLADLLILVEQVPHRRGARRAGRPLSRSAILAAQART